jgi:LmbE family N-acetylglucosaminyl deacetylase
MIGTPERIVIIAPHPDDETLGTGGTIARFADAGVELSVLIVSGHLPPLYPPAAFETTRREAEAALKVLGAKQWHFEQVPATKVHELPVAELNGRIARFVRETKPEVVLLPFPDRHIDHRVIFDASLVACRPVHRDAPRLVLAYETLSETHWNAPGIEPSFVPEFYVDITETVERKAKALACYESQVSVAPSRSVEAVRALAKFRGSQNGCGYAEAYKLIRAVV